MCIPLSHVDGCFGATTAGLKSCELDLGLAKPTQSILCLFTERFVDLIRDQEDEGMGKGSSKGNREGIPREEGGTL